MKISKITTIAAVIALCFAGSAAAHDRPATVIGARVGSIVYPMGNCSRLSIGTCSPLGLGIHEFSVNDIEEIEALLVEWLDGIEDQEPYLARFARPETANPTGRASRTPQLPDKEDEK